MTGRSAPSVISSQAAAQSHAYSASVLVVTHRRLPSAPKRPMRATASSRLSPAWRVVLDLHQGLSHDRISVDASST